MAADCCKTEMLLAAISLVVYWSSLHCGFVFDDSSAVVKNMDLRASTPVTELFLNDFWGTAMTSERSHKSYRPITVLTFRLNYLLHELRPLGYHVLNVALHALVCVLLHRTFTRIFEVNSDVSTAACLLFATHPVHVESVAGVVGRAELLSFLLALVALNIYPRYAACANQNGSLSGAAIHLALLVATMMLAMLCKETGITVAAVCAVLDIFLVCKKSLKDCVSLVEDLFRGRAKNTNWFIAFLVRQSTVAFSLMLLVSIRIWAVQGGKLPSFTTFDNPASMAETPARQLTLNYLVPINAWLLLCPSWLCCDWSMGTIDLIQSVVDPRNLATLLFWMAAIAVIMTAFNSHIQSSRTVTLGLSLIVFPYLPASNLFFPVGFVVAERILYTPSAGFCLLVALGFQRLKQHWNSKMANSMIFVVVLSFSLKTILRNYDWENEYSLFVSAVRVNKVNAKCWNNVGHALESQEDFHHALPFFLHAARVQPDDVGAMINVARTLRKLNNTADAEKWFYHAIDFMPKTKKGEAYSTRLNPNYLFAYISLANMIKEDPNRLEEADKLYQKAYTMRFDQVDAYTNRGELLIRQNRTAEAREMFLKARQFDEKSADVWYNLGVTYLMDGMRKEARDMFTRAVQLDPSHFRSKYNLASLMIERSSAREDKRRGIVYLEELWMDRKDDARIPAQLAAAHIELKEPTSALFWYRTTLEVDPNHVSSMFNMALTLSEMGQHKEGLETVDLAIQKDPSYVKARVLRGDILTKMRQLEAANEEFARVLQVQPNNLLAGHNYCVNLFNLNRLHHALQCMEKFAPIAPPGHEIHSHINLIKSRLQS